MKELKIITTLKTYTYQELDSTDMQLIEAARQAMLNAYAPYSRFNVGCAALLTNNLIIQASNQENIAFPSGSCAEANTVNFAKAQYPDEAITALAIIAASGNNMVEFISPCGNCRQILTEVEHRQKHPFRILLAGKHEVCILNSASDLLPFGFNAHIESSRP